MVRRRMQPGDSRRLDSTDKQPDDPHKIQGKVKLTAIVKPGQVSKRGFRKLWLYNVTTVMLPC